MFLGTVQALTAAGMSGASNVVAQLIVNKGPVKWRNAAAMAVRLTHEPMKSSAPAQCPKLRQSASTSFVSAIGMSLA